MAGMVEIAVHGTQHKVAVDGVDIAKQLKGVQVVMGAGELPVVILEYRCTEQFTFTGEAEVHHVCGSGGSGGSGGGT